MKKQVVLPLIIAFCLCAGCTTKRVTTNLTDSSDPTPVDIHGKLTGGGGESDAGRTMPGVFPSSVVLEPKGQLEITATATDNESGITIIEIHSNDRHCKWNGSTFATSGPEPTKIRDTVTNPPDSNGTVPVTAVSLANIQVSSELGTFDKVQWQFFGTATNSAGKMVNIGPLTYTAVSSTVPAAHSNDSCP